MHTCAQKNNSVSSSDNISVEEYLRVIPLTIRTIERDLTTRLLRARSETTQDLELLERLRTAQAHADQQKHPKRDTINTHISFQHCSSLAQPAQSGQNAVTLSYRLCFSCTVS